ncbi:phosphatase PAP2 family protein [Salidesulfovibrio onnuriiensis]|uniref:phosphatase PAP2 family protein n=1 Tax=Salidesulfovibrio onnuriiensis TaxID=2583823 RepID=UPI0011CAEC1B|nr:phosphatase PAP2 family protein [Salidesulfovibrio onnuriiensis]
MFFKTPALDAYLLSLINQQWKNPFFDALMPVLSNPFILYALLVPLLVWTWRKLGKRQIILVLVLLAGVGIADLGTNVVKKTIHRVRPLNALPLVHYQEDGHWAQRPADFVPTKERGTSYPSAHAANTMCIALLAMIFWPGLKKWPLLLPLLVGYSRVYLGKHYPLDVAAGWLFGVAAAAISWLLWTYVVEPLLPSPGKRD